MRPTLPAGIPNEVPAEGSFEGEPGDVEVVLFVGGEEGGGGPGGAAPGQPEAPSGQLQGRQR